MHYKMSQVSHHIFLRVENTLIDSKSVEAYLQCHVHASVIAVDFVKLAYVLMA
jgi:hypothetical protein